jgi:hypothetical protein
MVCAVVCCVVLVTGMLHVVWCYKLYVACCALFVVWCYKLYVVCCVVYVVCYCMLCDNVFCVISGVCCLLLHVA